MKGKYFAATQQRQNYFAVNSAKVFKSTLCVCVLLWQVDSV